MVDFDVQRCTKRCAGADRELQAGEEIYSVLVADGASVVRQDFSADGWDGPPESAIGWWKSRMADAGSKKASWAPNDVMLDYFLQLEDKAEKIDVRYVLALLLVRRRIARLEESEFDEDGNENLVIFCPGNETEYRVPVYTPSVERARQIQDELTQLLMTE